MHANRYSAHLDVTLRTFLALLKFLRAEIIIAFTIAVAVYKVKVAIASTNSNCNYSCSCYRIDRLTNRVAKVYLLWNKKRTYIFRLSAVCNAFGLVTFALI